MLSLFWSIVWGIVLAFAIIFLFFFVLSLIFGASVVGAVKNLDFSGLTRPIVNAGGPIGGATVPRF